MKYIPVQAAMTSRVLKFDFSGPALSLQSYLGGPRKTKTGLEITMTEEVVTLEVLVSGELYT